MHVLTSLTVCGARFDAEEDVLAAVDMFAFAPQPREPVRSSARLTRTQSGLRFGRPGRP